MSSVRRTRVLTVTDSLDVGGAERVAVDIANSLDRRTHEVLICATRHGGPLQATLRDDVDVTILDRRATWDPTGPARFARLVRRERIDIVHSHARGTMKFVALCRRTGLIDTPHVFHDHYGRLHLDRRAPSDLRSAMRLGVDEYLGVDSRLCAWARQSIGLAPDRVHLARSGVDLSRFEGVVPVDLRDACDLPGREVVLVMVANFRQQKDHPTVLRAVAALPEDLRRRLAVVFVGSTTAEPAFTAHCRAMIDDLGIEDQVRTVGEQSDPLRWIAGADGAVLASKNETGPLVVLEYMGCGVPFVATDTGEITRSVRDLDIGFLPAPRDHREVADALAALIELGPSGRRAMGERGARAAAERFGQAGVTRRIEAVYRDVLDRRRHGAAAPAGRAPGARSVAGH